MSIQGRLGPFSFLHSLAKRGRCKNADVTAEDNMPQSPESEILAKFFADMGEKRFENLT